MFENNEEEKSVEITFLKNDSIWRSKNEKNLKKEIWWR